jgi:hypothetical protein
MNLTPSCAWRWASRAVFVGRRGGHDMLVQDRAVDRQPLALTCLDLVRNCHMRVEVRVPGPRVTMHKRSGHQAAGLELAGAARAFAGEDRMRLQERERTLHGGVVGLLDLARDLGQRDRPQRRDRLRRTEREVEARGRSLPELPPQCGAGHRMTAVAEQVAHLLSGHHVAVLDAVEPDRAGADPAARGLALRLVVVDQPGAAELSRIGGPWRVRYSYPDPAASLLQRHRHTP